MNERKQHLFEASVDELNFLACEFGRFLQDTQLLRSVVDSGEQGFIQVFLCFIKSINSLADWSSKQAICKTKRIRRIRFYP
jgi:hypothetical protein